MNRMAAPIYLATMLLPVGAIGAPGNGVCGTGTLIDVQVHVEMIQAGTMEHGQERAKKNGKKEYDSYSTNYLRKQITYTVTARFDDMVYTAQSESIFGFGFKPTSFVVNDPIQGCVRDNTIALARPDGKEYKAHILHAARIPQPDLTARFPPDIVPESRHSRLQFVSNPIGADIEVDGAFVGSTPSEVELAVGDHGITITKLGYQTWRRMVHVTGGEATVNAGLRK
jgi:hypothetical protein